VLITFVLSKYEGATQIPLPYATLFHLLCDGSLDNTTFCQATPSVDLHAIVPSTGTAINNSAHGLEVVEVVVVELVEVVVVEVVDVVDVVDTEGSGLVLEVEVVDVEVVDVV